MSGAVVDTDMKVLPVADSVVVSVAVVDMTVGIVVVAVPDSVTDIVLVSDTVVDIV